MPLEPARDPLAVTSPAVRYQPGLCNIGDVEIARRRRAGHVGTAVTVGLLGLLLGLRAPRAARLVVLLPAAGAASGYLQARMRFCAGFGTRGVYNFGSLGREEPVKDARARSLDRSRSIQIGAWSLGIGIVAALVAFLIPLS